LRFLIHRIVPVPGLGLKHLDDDEIYVLTQCGRIYRLAAENP